MGLLVFSSVARRRLRAPRRRVGTKRDATQHRAFRGRSRGRQRGRRGVGSEGGVREGDRALFHRAAARRTRRAARRRAGRLGDAPIGRRQEAHARRSRLPRRRGLGVGVGAEARHGAATIAPFAIGIDHGRPAARHRAATAAAVPKIIAKID